jgi:hypothetical protein
MITLKSGWLGFVRVLKSRCGADVLRSFLDLREMNNITESQNEWRAGTEIEPGQRKSVRQGTVENISSCTSMLFLSALCASCLSYQVTDNDYSGKWKVPHWKSVNPTAFFVTNRLEPQTEAGCALWPVANRGSSPSRQSLRLGDRSPRKGSHVSEAKNADQSRESGGLLPPAWVVDEEAWVRLTPILKYLD